MRACRWACSTNASPRSVAINLNPFARTRPPIRVLLADDHVVFRAGVRALLKQRPDLAVVGEAGTGNEAVASAAATRPDVVLMDLAMPGEGGLVATRPPSPGIAKSIRTTSGRVAAALATASFPVPASPTTARSGRCFRSARTPARKTTWSSANRTRMGGRVRAKGLRLIATLLGLAFVLHAQRHARISLPAKRVRHETGGRGRRCSPGPRVGDAPTRQSVARSLQFAREILSAECGVRHAELVVRASSRRSLPRIEPSPSIPHATFRIPHSLHGSCQISTRFPGNTGISTRFRLAS